MNIVLAAEEAAGLQMLRAVASSGHRVVAVLTTRPRTGTVASIWSVARSSGFETWPAELVRDPALADHLRSAGVDLLLNVYSLHIIADRVLSAPRLGAFNLHPGPLPRYAGLNAVSWAIYRGEKTHGVTIHKMETGIDTGPIVYQSVFPIEDSATGLSLSFKCMREGVRLMLKFLKVVSTEPHSIPLALQDLTQREYFDRTPPNNGVLSWASPAKHVLNFVRACDYLPFRSPWGHPQTRWRDCGVGVVKVSATGLRCDAPPGTVQRRVDSGVVVACLDECVLIKQLKIGERYVHAADILSSGDRLGCESNEQGSPEITQYAGSRVQN